MSYALSSLPVELEYWRDRIRRIAIEMGLDFFEVIYEMVDFQQMNEIAAYMGFPTRYPHWRWGMEYERMRRSYTYGLHKIYEMVINNDPSYAYLLNSNELLDQKLVMAHVYGHSDFFKNNMWFAPTNKKMMDEMANHATKVRRIVDRIGMDEVETFIDVCLSLENLIDRHGMYRPAPVRLEQSGMDRAESEYESDIRRPPQSKLKVERDYMDAFINPPEALRGEAEKMQEQLRAKSTRFPAEPQRDVLGFLLLNAPLERWQQDILEIIRAEAYYFAPQGMTKIMNEGWACARGDTLVFTDKGLIRLDEIVNERNKVMVSDGDGLQRVYDWAKFEDHETVWLKTKRGYEIEGSVTHRLMLKDGSWRRMDEIHLGDSVRVSGGCNQWATDYVQVSWQPEQRLTLEKVAELANVHLSTVIRYRDGMRGPNSTTLAPLIAEYDNNLQTMTFMQNKRQAIRIPHSIDESFGAFLGYLTGDGHISKIKRIIGLTTGDDEQADCFIRLVRELFAIEPTKRRDGGKWRIAFYSKNVESLLEDLGLPTGRAARIKTFPKAILQSPKSVVAAFIRAYFDCDGYAGKQGVILSTASEEMSITLQVVLLNFGILSTRKLQNDGVWHVRITGEASLVFEREIGFGLIRKQKALRKYIESHQWMFRLSWNDKVVAIERRRADVYDLSVETTHRYAAQGFINHNSHWHSHMMTHAGIINDAEIVDYADHHSGTMAMSPRNINPYKIGIELLRDIEERWDKGQFGVEWDSCDDSAEKLRWDTHAGLGRQKIFEVRRVYNDVGFIDTFFTEDFCNKHHLFTYQWNERTGRYEIASRDFEKIKRQLLFSLTNFGQPVMEVVDANYENRGSLLLAHRYEGVELKLDEAKDTMENLYKVWKRPVFLQTLIDDEPHTLTFNGSDHRLRKGHG
jgi:stage V sporulation protein R